MALNSATEHAQMEFRLVYQGRLPAASQSSNRAQDKHRIRKALHPQLRELWKANRYLRGHFLSLMVKERPKYQIVADNYARCGYRFLPLEAVKRVMKRVPLDILFLRRDQPGDLLPVATDERINDVYLVIHVRTISFAEVITV